MEIVPDRETGCLVWQGQVNKDGYPVGRLYRKVYEDAHGPIPYGWHIDHVYERGCRYHACINLDHLELVTRDVNFKRARAAGSKGHRTRPQRHMMLPMARTELPIVSRPALREHKPYVPAGGGGEWWDIEQDDDDLSEQIGQWLASRDHNRVRDFLS